MGFLYKDFIGRHQNLWAYLEETTPKWCLTVYLFVNYAFLSSHEGDPEWTEEEQESWVTAFETSAESTWSRRWPIKGISLDGKSAVSLEAVLEIRNKSKESLEGHGRITKINVYHDCAPGCPRSKVPPVTSDTGLLTQLLQQSVNLKEPKIEGHSTGSLQRASDHEVGHMLGLIHPLCAGSEPKCYGHKDTPDGDEVMGLGMKVLQRDYEVFVEIIQRIRPTYNWTIPERFERPFPLIRRIPLVGGGYRVEGRELEFVVKRKRP